MARKTRKDPPQKAKPRSKPDRSGYVVRGITFRVAAPLGVDTPRVPYLRFDSWEQFDPLLDQCLGMAARLANWCVQQLHRLDATGSRETPAAVSDWLQHGYVGPLAAYPELGLWGNAKQTLSLTARATHRHYLRKRFDALVRYKNHLLTLKDPQPFRFHNQTVRLSHAPGGFPVVSVPFPGVGRIALRLARRGHGRQLAGFRELLDGKAVPGEARISRDGKGHTLLTLAGWFPRRKARKHKALCGLYTAADALLAAEVAGRRTNLTNADQLRRWHAAHRRESSRGGTPCVCSFAPEAMRDAVARHKDYLRRTSEDLKRERRMDRRQRANLLKARGFRCDKHRHRLDTFLHQVTAQVVRFCQRQRVGTLVYDDRDKSFFPDGFPWHSLKTYLGYKCDAAGITFVASGGAANDSPGTARTEGGDEPVKTCASATRSRNGHPGQSARGRSRNAVKTGPGDRLKPTAPE